MKDIHLSEKESKKITSNLRSALGAEAVPEQITKIGFHKDFDEGERLAVCKSCGFPVLFYGSPDGLCDCDKPDPTVYTIEQAQEFILDLQKHWYKFNRGKNGKRSY